MNTTTQPGPLEVRLSEVLGVLLNGEETMEYTAKLPTEVGLYRHRWDFRGQMREQVLFVGYTNARAPRLQGSEPNAYMPRKWRKPAMPSLSYRATITSVSE